MSRERGTFRFPFNYERQKVGNLDATKFVPSYNELFSFTQDNYMYNGATVEVWDNDPNLRGVYMLIDVNNLNNQNSWEKITSSDNIPSDISELTDTTNLLFSGDYDDLSNLPSLFSGDYDDLSNKPTIIEAYINPTGSTSQLLDNTDNWDINGDYIGTTITNTFQGQKHYNNNYFFEAVDDNIWIRLIRG